ncbi:MAG: sulfatase, partial [Myxococcota bacterium]
YEKRTDAALDSLRAESTVFSRCSAPAPWTGPSVASLMTGLFTARHRVNPHGARLPESQTTIAQLLKRNGWHTFGASFNPQVSRTTGHHRGFDTWTEHTGDATAYPDIEEMLARVRGWLVAEPRTPFFVYLQPMNVHGPYLTPEESRDDLLGRTPVAGFQYYDFIMNAVLKGGDRSRVTSTYLQSLVEQYDTAIHYTLTKLAGFFDFLRKRGSYGRSLIILTSDHGEELFEHGGFSHGFSLYEEVLHVPLYIKLPGQTQPRAVETPVQLMDLLPTLAELLDLELNFEPDGISLRRYLVGDPQTSTAALRRTRLHQTSWESRCLGRAIVESGYKLIEIDRDWQSNESRTLLFDLSSDPDERHDMSAKRPLVVRRLEHRLDELFEHYASLSSGEPENVRKQMDEERLRALGYVE